jgi:hypothetical protein
MSAEVSLELALVLALLVGIVHAHPPMPAAR